MKIRTLTKTCDACPAQWEGETDDNRPVYIRYRWGWLEVTIGKQNETIQEALLRTFYDDNGIFALCLGGEFDGTMTDDVMMPHLEAALRKMEGVDDETETGC